jgi:hypothetical protein
LFFGKGTKKLRSVGVAPGTRATLPTGKVFLLLFLQHKKAPFCIASTQAAAGANPCCIA